MKIKDLQQQGSLNKGILVIILVALFIPHWIIIYDAIQNTIGPDLLLRTIGSRLQEAGKSIYQYSWKPGDPTGWLNPYPDTRVGLNGVVSTPFTLWLLQPLAKLDYCSIRNIWGFIQELLLFSTVYLCCLFFKKRLTQLIFILIAIVFFVYNRNWYLNIYNGQMYIFYAFIFAFSGYLISTYKNEKFLLFLFPLISTVRPFFITSIIPFFKIKKQHIVTIALSVVLALVLVLTTSPTDEWKQYNKAMKIYAKEQTNELVFDTAAVRIGLPFAESCTLNPEATFTSFGAGCLYSLQHYLFLFGISVSNLLFYQVILFIMLLSVLFISYKRGWLDDIPKQLLLSFLCYQLCELITPASRNPYNMIQWLPAVAWIVAAGNRSATVLVVVGLCFNHDIPFRFPYEREVGEALLFVALIVILFQNKDYKMRHKITQA